MKSRLFRLQRAFFQPNQRECGEADIVCNPLQACNSNARGLTDFPEYIGTKQFKVRK